MNDSFIFPLLRFEKMWSKISFYCFDFKWLWWAYCFLWVLNFLITFLFAFLCSIDIAIYSMWLFLCSLITWGWWERKHAKKSRHWTLRVFTHRDSTMFQGTLAIMTLMLFSTSRYQINTSFSTLKVAFAFDTQTNMGGIHK